MTDSYASLKTVRGIIDDLESHDQNTIPPQHLDPSGKTIFTNPQTGATYKYISKTPPVDLNGNVVPDERKGNMDEYGNVQPGQSQDEGSWIQITKQTEQPTNTDIIIKTSYDLLRERVEVLEARVAALS
jgi:hypothetical protein